jgi:hypothetical protein
MLGNVEPVEGHSVVAAPIDMKEKRHVAYPVVLLQFGRLYCAIAAAVVRARCAPSRAISVHSPV